MNERLEAQDRRHEHERGELRAHVRTTKDHAPGEVDLARQALQKLGQAATLPQPRPLATRPGRPAIAAQREPQAQAALARGCAAQLATLGHLPQQLSAAFKKARPPVAPRRRRPSPGTP